MKILHPLTIRNRLLWYAAQSEPAAASPGLRGSIVGAINKLCVEKHSHTDDEGNEIVLDITSKNRRLVLGWLLTPDDAPFAEMSSMDLTSQQLRGIQLWMEGVKIDGVWLNRAGWNTEVAWLLTKAKSANAVRKAELFSGEKEILMRDVLEIKMTPSSPDADTLKNIPMASGMLSTAIRYLGGDVVGEIE